MQGKARKFRIRKELGYMLLEIAQKEKDYGRRQVTKELRQKKGIGMEDRNKPARRYRRTDGPRDGEEGGSDDVRGDESERVGGDNNGQSS